MPTCANFAYMSFNLYGEVGEFFSCLAKAIRKDIIEIEKDAIVVKPGKAQEWQQVRKDLLLELGDVLWQLSGLTVVLGAWLPSFDFVEDDDFVNNEDSFMRAASGLLDNVNAISHHYDNMLTYKRAVYKASNLEPVDIRHSLSNAVEDRFFVIVGHIARLANLLDSYLDEVAQHNLAKLADRQTRGVIDGSGDHR